MEAKTNSQSHAPLESSGGISIHNVTVIYNNRPALDNVTLEIPHGSHTAIVGPNGAGKSTLFKALVGLATLESGSIRIHSEPLEYDHYCISYVPQREEVDLRFPITVREVIMMGRFRRYGLIRSPSSRDHEIVDQSLAQLSIEKLAKRTLNELSGGQIQRVFLARALAQEPHILLMDEPFNGVDVSTQEATLQLLSELKNRNVTVLVSTHDLNLAARKFEQVVLLKRKLIAYGKPVEVMKKEHLSAAFGEQIFMLDDAVLVDHCCPSEFLEGK